MFECLKDGYNFFAKYDKGNLIATLTLKEGDIYKDVVKLEDDELVFLYTFKSAELVSFLITNIAMLPAPKEINFPLNGPSPKL